MKRRRGMSLQEKRETMLRIMRDSKTVWLLKELESTGNKAGVVAQSVKDVIQSLEDDGLIKIDKVGSQNFYWSFPSDALNKAQNRRTKLQGAIAGAGERLKKAESLLEASAEGKDESAGRDAKLTRLGELETEHARLSAELATLRANDPEVLAELQAKVKVARDAANRWTDNVWQAQSVLVNKFGKPSSDVAQAMGITADFDYPFGS